MKALILKALAPLLNSRLRPFLLSWKTSLAGVGLLAASLAEATTALLSLADGADLDTETWARIAAQTVAGWGFLVGKDADRTADGEKV